MSGLEGGREGIALTLRFFCLHRVSQVDAVASSATLTRSNHRLSCFIPAPNNNNDNPKKLLPLCYFSLPLTVSVSVSLFLFISSFFFSSPHFSFFFSSIFHFFFFFSRIAANRQISVGSRRISLIESLFDDTLFVSLSCGCFSDVTFPFPNSGTDTLNDQPSASFDFIKINFNPRPAWACCKITFPS